MDVVILVFIILYIYLISSVLLPTRESKNTNNLKGEFAK